MTSEYEEFIGLGLVVSAASPVYTDQGVFVGVAILDLSLAELTAEIESASPLAGGYSFLINESGRIIALSDTSYPDLLGRARNTDELGPNAVDVVPAFTPVVNAMMNGETGFKDLMIHDRELSVAYAPMRSTGWSLAHVAETSELLQVLQVLDTELDRSTQALILSRVLPIGFLVLLITVGISLWLTVRLVDPLRKLAHAATLIGGGNWEESLSSTGEIGIAAKREDEVGELARSFQGMSEQLRLSFGNLERSNAALRLVQDELQSANESLEQRVIARTQEMAAFYDVTLLTSESQNMSDLLEPALSRILDIGKCQAACIHLIAEDQSSLQLVARQGLVSIEIDQVETLAIPLEYQSHVSQSGDPILVSDSMNSAAMPIELGLERFHTYMGAQLRARGSSLGLLSCFRESGERFSINEISLIVALAEQLGIAVENHRLNQNTREMAVLEERERLANSLSQIQEHSMTALNEMRLSLYQLQPTTVENEGLAQALEGRLDSVERQLGIEAHLEITGDVDLPIRVAGELYYIAIEALNNVLRHADASKVTVRVSSNHKQTELQIADNGRGFDTENVSQGMGLGNMKARTEFLSGQLDFESTPGGGTTVTVVIDTSVEGR